MSLDSSNTYLKHLVASVTYGWIYPLSYDKNSLFQISVFDILQLCDFDELKDEQNETSISIF